MDLTALFKASVKTVRLRNKTLVVPDKSRILKSKSRDEFTFKAKDIRHQISQLRDLLIENRTAYMRFGYHLKAFAQMSNEERDIIDEESEKIILICNQFIGDLRANCKQSRTTNKQCIEYQLAVLNLLEDYLRAVFRIHNEQKTSRVQHELDTYKLLKLESNKKLIPVCAPKERGRGFRKLIENYENGSEDLQDASTEHDRLEDDLEPRRISKSNKSLSELAIDEDNAVNRYSLEDEHLEAEDVQMFESENSQLINEMQGLSEEVEQIERNVVDIAKLQDLLTEKVRIRAVLPSGSYQPFLSILGHDSEYRHRPDCHTSGRSH